MEIVKDKRNAGVKQIPDLKDRRVSFPSDIGRSKHENSTRLASSKYRVLPEISEVDRNEKTFKAQDSSKARRQSGIQKTSISRHSKAEDLSKQSRAIENQKCPESNDLRRPHHIQVVERTFSLAIKLPDGGRIVSNFEGSDSLMCVLRRAETKASRSFKGCQLMCHKEQKVYDDLDLLLADSGIEDKTTLYVQLPEKDLCSPKNFLS